MLPLGTSPWKASGPWILTTNQKGRELSTEVPEEADDDEEVFFDDPAETVGPVLQAQLDETRRVEEEAEQASLDRANNGEDAYDEPTDWHGSEVQGFDDDHEQFLSVEESIRLSTERDDRERMLADLPRLNNIDGSTLVGEAEPREWLAESLFPYGVVSGLYGPGGAGKTLLMQQLQTACALLPGTKWLGTPVDQCVSVGVYTEDDTKEIHRRQANINRLYEIEGLPPNMAHYIDREDAVENTLQDFFHKDGRERSLAMLTPFYYQLTEFFRTIQPRLITLDNIGTLYGGNESDRFEPPHFVRAALGAWAREFQAVVILIGHFSKGSASTGQLWAGSTSWDAAFRLRSAFYRPDPPDGDEMTPELARKRTFSIEKSNYGPQNITLDCEFKDGVYVAVEPASSFERVAQANMATDLVYDLLRKHINTGLNFSFSMRSPNYPPVRLYSLEGEALRDAKVTRNDIDRAIETLRREGKIAVSTYHRKVREQIEIVGDEAYRNPKGGLL